MPIYEYQCTHCHHQFDLLQKINEAPATLCPNCSKSALVKLVSAAGFQLKGTGWYETDFKNKNNPMKPSVASKSVASKSDASSSDSSKTVAKESSTTTAPPNKTTTSET